MELFSSSPSAGGGPSACFGAGQETHWLSASSRMQGFGRWVIIRLWWTNQVEVLAVGRCYLKRWTVSGLGAA